MSRPQKFTRDAILDGARDAVFAHGRGATIAQVSQQIGAPTGSIYHRFASRDELFVALWLRSIQRFHVGLLEAAAGPDAQLALLDIALHSVRYCRDHPAEALAMTLYRHRDLLRNGPAALSDEVRTLNVEVFAAIDRLCSQRYPHPTGDEREIVLTAVQQLPYALVRPHIGEAVPAWLDDATLAAAQAVLALGDHAAHS